MQNVFIPPIYDNYITANLKKTNFYVNLQVMKATESSKILKLFCVSF